MKITADSIVATNEIIGGTSYDNIFHRTEGLTIVQEDTNHISDSITSGSDIINFSSKRWLSLLNKSTLTDWYIGQLFNDPTNYTGFGVDVVNREENGDFMIYTGTRGGTFNEISNAVVIGSNNGSVFLNFTGQHRCIIPGVSSEHLGLIVEVKSNEIVNIDKSLKPTINESLPMMQLCKTRYSKKVFGVVTYPEEQLGSSRIFRSGNIKHITPTHYSNESRFTCNSVGEGGVWVCNQDGPFECGDFITTSSVTGYGIRQDDDVMHNYTMGKITIDCPFSLTKIKKKVLDTTVDEKNKETLQYDSSGNLLYKDVLDTSGNIIMCYPLDTRFVDANGILLSGEDEYHTRKANGEEVFIACFVGCVYYCG